MFEITIIWILYTVVNSSMFYVILITYIVHVLKYIHLAFLNSFVVLELSSGNSSTMKKLYEGKKLVKCWNYTEK